MSQRLSALVHRDLAIDPEIVGITADSRTVRPGMLFAALPGARQDGRKFIEAAVAAGASAILAGEDAPGLSIPVVTVHDPRRAYALATRVFYGNQPPVCVAVTGTNGKTSVATFCRQMFARQGLKAASLGTLGICRSTPGQADMQLTQPGLTTPDAGDLASQLADLAQQGVTHVALEASSHGLDQRRLDGVTLTAAAFLNLTQDHLDYHGSMEAYQQSKLRLFDTLLPTGASAVINADSDAAAAFLATSVTRGHRCITVGTHGQALMLTARQPTPEGQRLEIKVESQSFTVHLPLAGAFQAANALAAAGLVISTGGAPEATLASLEHLVGASGRLQRVGTGSRGGEAYVDYAHTPDGLETVLSALRPHARGRLIVVFGAGGDRDRGKRPLMGAIAAKRADVAIVTDDNPRSEPPDAIRKEIRSQSSNLLEIADRREAIIAAVAMLDQGDVLVVAGKGHEQGQIIGNVVHPFDDVTVVAEALGLEDRCR